MAQINLLPWRDELRKEKQRQFVSILALAVLVAGALTFGAYQFVEEMITAQKERNRFLETEITILDKQIKEIEALEKKKQELKTRIDIIQDLQQSRPLIVRMFDELVRVVPSGVYLSELKKRGNKYDFQGRAESESRVAYFNRNLDLSEWFRSVRLSQIKREGSRGKNDDKDWHTFTMSATQYVPGQEDKK